MTTRKFDMRFLRGGLCMVLLLAVMFFPDAAFSGSRMVKGQAVYVPAYSQIYYGDKEHAFDLTVTLSIRNTDTKHAITLVSSVEYYNSEGKRLKNYIDGDTKIGPMASARYIVNESDQSGGAGASFRVKWKSDADVTEPVIETVMISTRTQQGISFTSRGVVVRENLVDNEHVR
jgi:hypothetical protein